MTPENTSNLSLFMLFIIPLAVAVSAYVIYGYIIKFKANSLINSFQAAKKTKSGVEIYFNGYTIHLEINMTAGCLSIIIKHNKNIPFKFINISKKTKFKPEEDGYLFFESRSIKTGNIDFDKKYFILNSRNKEESEIIINFLKSEILSYIDELLSIPDSECVVIKEDTVSFFFEGMKIKRLNKEYLEKTFNKLINLCTSFD